MAEKRRYAWEEEGRMPTEKESESMANEEYEYLVKMIDEGYPSKRAKKQEKKKEEPQLGILRMRHKPAQDALGD